MEEELEKRKDEIENEVARRVESAKKQMEHEMMVELEKRREQARFEERKREVGFLYINLVCVVMSWRRRFMRSIKWSINTMDYNYL